MVKGKMLLKKTPTSKDISDADVFSFNEKFDSKLMKIKFAAAGGPKEVLLLHSVLMPMRLHVHACCGITARPPF